MRSTRHHIQALYLGSFIIVFVLGGIFTGLVSMPWLSSAAGLSSLKVSGTVTAGGGFIGDGSRLTDVRIPTPQIVTSSVVIDAPLFSATGGTITHVSGRTIHTFTSSGTFTPNGTQNIEVLVVAGGGGGGGGFQSPGGGGGGAGGVLYNAALAVAAGPIAVTVGAGGIGGVGDVSSPGGLVRATSGQNSKFDTLIAIGGGGGAPGYNAFSGLSGGSGGGSGYGAGAGGAGTIGQGNAGGGNATVNPSQNGAGGGGAGGVGADPSSAYNTPAGAGGSGKSFTTSGVLKFYGGGGGGGNGYNGSIAFGTRSNGGLGGGGQGGLNNGAFNGLSGATNTGGGGGGAGAANPGQTNGTGGNGGSGIVIVSYPDNATIGEGKISVVCPINTKVVGGGCKNINTSASTNWESGPKDDNKWSCGGTFNANPSGYAICIPAQ